MTPDQMRKIGNIFRGQSYYSDEELQSGIDTLDLVVPFLEGAGFSHWITGPLGGAREALKRIQDGRK